MKTLSEYITEYLIKKKVDKVKKNRSEDDITLGEFFAWYISGEKEWDDVNKKDAIDVLESNDEPELNDFEDARDMLNYIDDHKDDVISLEQTKELNDYNVKITNTIDNRVIEIVTSEMYKKQK